MIFIRPSRREFLSGAGAALLATSVRAQDIPYSALREPGFKLRAVRSPTRLTSEEALEAPNFGTAAGPVLKLERGTALTASFANDLDIAVTVATQGLRGRAVDGADTPVAPGETRKLVFTAPDPGSFLYRLIAADTTREGDTILLAGPIVVSADEPSIADQDVVVALNAIALPDKGAGKPPRRLALVNGAPDLKLKARPGERLRLRFINLNPFAPAAAVLPEGVAIIALDGQPCPPFPPLERRLILPPLGRADVLVEAAQTGMMQIQDDFEAGRFLVDITVEGEPAAPRELAGVLPDNPALPRELPLQKASRATWKAGSAPKDPLVTAKKGQTVEISIANGEELCAVAIEGHTARHLDALDDGWKPWWNDTLLIEPGATERLAFIAGEPGRYAVNLMPLEGEAPSARAFFVVS
jgi:FtsP/CotA-like multicopper oxidase with cupredoxin domain